MGKMINSDKSPFFVLVLWSDGSNLPMITPILNFPRPTEGEDQR